MGRGDRLTDIHMLEELEQNSCFDQMVPCRGQFTISVAPQTVANVSLLDLHVSSPHACVPGGAGSSRSPHVTLHGDAPPTACSAPCRPPTVGASIALLPGPDAGFNLASCLQGIRVSCLLVPPRDLPVSGVSLPGISLLSEVIRCS